MSIGKRRIDGITCFIKSQLSGSKLSEIHTDFLTSNSRIANKSGNKGNVLIQLCSYEIGMLQMSGISGISNFTLNIHFTDNHFFNNVCRCCYSISNVRREFSISFKNRINRFEVNCNFVIMVIALKISYFFFLSISNIFVCCREVILINYQMDIYN